MGEVVLLIAVICVLISINGFFVAAEFAILSVSRPRIEQLAAEGSAAARKILSVISQAIRQDRYVATSQLGMSLTSLGLGMYAEHALVALLIPYLQQLGSLQYPLAHSVSTGLVLVVLTFWHILLGEMVPKSVALVRAEPTALALIGPMIWVGRLLWPFVQFLNLSGHAIIRLLRLPVSKDISLVYSNEELRLIFEESKDKGMLEVEEHELMEKVMSFGKRAVRQVMVGRTRAVGLQADATVDQALAFVAKEAYTRYPVFEGDMDHIIGIVHVKDLLRSRHRLPGEQPIRELVRKVPYVPESMWTSELFDKMRVERSQLAVVIDEHGGTAGIVTMEDLVEEVFGEVRDEFDVEEEEPITRLGDHTFKVRGEVPLHALADVLDRELDFDDVETVNGLVMDELGRPPRVGDLVEAQGLRLLVESVQGLVVGTARVTDLTPPPPPETDEGEPAS